LSGPERAQVCCLRLIDFVAVAVNAHVNDNAHVNVEVVVDRS
jgi:hypothetical protein